MIAINEVTHIEIVRHGCYYFQNRLGRNGSIISIGNKISRDRAMQIVSEHEGGNITRSGIVTFDPGYHEFTWTVEL